MRGKFLPAILAAFLITALSSCTVMKSTYQKQVDENEVLAKQNDALRKERDSLKADLAERTQQRDKLATDFDYVTGQLNRATMDREEVRRKVSALEKENAELVRVAQSKEEQVEQVKKASSTYQDLLEKMKVEVERGEVTIQELKGKLSVNLVDSILFESGRAEVKQGGEEILAKVVSTLTEVRDKVIRIEGHTDNVAIAGALAKRYPTNWELSAARAINVARFLQGQGVPTDRLSAVAYGEWKPVGDNATPEGRAKNRRIEISLVDKEQP
jgi:chemotaxis protein MotB